MKWTVSLFLLLLSFSAFGEAKNWMKQTNPNSLGLFAWVSSSCPFTEAELVNRIEGEFLRARLKPTKSLSFNLTVNIKCMSVENKGGTLLGNVVSYEIRYGTKMANGENVLFESPDHGSMLVGSNDVSSTQYFISTITDGVALSLTDYLKANFE
jgi:hypothetical protein